MRKQSVNTFNKGFNPDLNVLNTPSDTYIGALNATLINLDGDEFILQNERGNQQAGSLSEGFVLLGVEGYNGIAYILSYNPTTGQGEIGTFPSPDYFNTTTNADGNEEGAITNEYRPLNNFTGANNNIPANVGSFTTDLFNFDLTRPLEVEIQPSYDGTVNVIFTDNNERVRIINSRFRQLSNNRFEVIDRTGMNDVNIYNNDSFDTTINLIQRTPRILDLELEEITVGGGQLPCGNYKYYFRYGDQDGNLTDIIEESAPVSIFVGDAPFNIRGGQPNENSGKSVTFSLSNIDTSFNSVQVFFVYEAADTDNAPVGVARRINVDYVINDRESLTIRHTGFEGTTNIDISELSLTFSTFDTGRSLAQIQGRLLVANLDETNTDNTLLRNFASQVRISGQFSDSYTMEYGFNSTDMANIFSTPRNSNVISPNQVPLGQAGGTATGLRNNMYWNEQNLYYFTGYWDQEIYEFGIVFILPDGSESQVFPLRGTLTDDYSGTIDPNTGFDATTGLNDRGVYRFNDNLESVGPTSLRIRGVKFLFDNVDSNLFTQIQEATVGYYFTRTERVRNILAEGYMLPTTGHLNDPEELLTTGTIITDTSPRTPSLLGHFEALAGSRNNYPAFHLVTQNGANNRLYSNTSDKVALVIPDMFTERTRLISDLTTTNTYLQGTGRVMTAPGNFFTADVDPLEQSTMATSYSTATIDLLTSGSIIEGLGTFIPARTRAPQSDFNSIHSYLAANNQVFNNEFESYIGYTPEQRDNLISYTSELVSAIQQRYITFFGGGTTGQVDVQFVPGSEATGEAGILRHAATRVRLYTSADPYNISNVAARYQNIGDNTYFAISKRFNWLETLVDNNTLAFRGDCYKNISLRRISMSPPAVGDPTVTTQEEIPMPPEQFINGAGRESAFLLSVITSNNSNTNLRDEIIADAAETAAYGRERPFYPFSIRNAGLGNDTRIRTIRAGEFKLEETNGYNQGYNEEGSDRNLVPFAFDAPFQDTRFDTRISYSNIFINNEFANGYRTFAGLNFRDYSRHLGEIVRIENVNNSLVMVQENGVSIIGVNDRTIVGADTSGSIFVDQAQVLHPRPFYLSESYGSRWQWSIKKSRNFLYGVDVDNDKIWRTEGNQLKILSDFSVQEILRDNFPSYKNNSPNILDIDVVTHYNSRKYDLIFTFYEKGNPSNTLSLVYNELYNKWISPVSYRPYKSFNLYDKFYTLNSEGEDNSTFWIHDQLETNGTYCNFYGTQHPFEIEFVVIENAAFQKMFDNMRIISNKTEVPIEIVYNTDNDTDVTQEIVQRTNTNIFSYNAYLKENHVYIEVTKNGNRRIRDKYARIKIRYTGNNHVVIQSIINFFRYSYA